MIFERKVTKQKRFKVFSVSVQLHLEAKWHKWRQKQEGGVIAMTKRGNSH